MVTHNIGEFVRFSKFQGGPQATNNVSSTLEFIASRVAIFSLAHTKKVPAPLSCVAGSQAQNAKHPDLGLWWPDFCALKNYPRRSRRTRGLQRKTWGAKSSLAKNNEKASATQHLTCGCRRAKGQDQKMTIGEGRNPETVFAKQLIF